MKVLNSTVRLNSELSYILTFFFIKANKSNLSQYLLITRERTDEFMTFSRMHEVKHNQLRPGFELKSPIFYWFRFTSRTLKKVMNSPVLSPPPLSLSLSLEQAAASISLHVNAHKTEYMCYNQTGDISTLNGCPLKLVDKFTYLGSSTSSTETDINTQLAKAWTAIHRLLVIWKSDLTDKM